MTSHASLTSRVYSSPNESSHVWCKHFLNVLKKVDISCVKTESFNYRHILILTTGLVWWMGVDCELIFRTLCHVCTCSKNKNTRKCLSRAVLWRFPLIYPLTYCTWKTLIYRQNSFKSHFRVDFSSETNLFPSFTPSRIQIHGFWPLCTP